MGLYLLRRIGFGIFVIWAAFTIVYFILYLLPGDPVAAAAGAAGIGNEAELEQKREELGFNLPWYQQYFAALLGLVTGDFGNTIGSGEPAIDVVLRALPNTLKLAGLGLVFTVIIGLGVALLATLPRAGWLRRFIASLPPIAVAIPSFWLGIVLLQVFSFGLGWFPAFDMGNFASLVLPALTLGIFTGSYLAQVLIAGLRTEMSSAYADQVRSKGASRSYTVFRHALRNASLPGLNIAGVLVGGLLGGTVVTENVFSRDGLGGVLLDAVTKQEISVVLAVVVLAAIAFVIITLIVDFVTPLIDRRILVRSSRASA
ncbi:ABC transporter permease [Gulosibacter molinativorax]|uniref:ABC transporter permease n=1 Tax=Gulosibacter molinativorax TaxID=256821 RepID=A0ABT7C5F3_9MICO|nr:ABC transporter permease [Gulosibacter molinativorax]MDJ1370414.1 ABC transporter permease [Gulosibacter molinativorax]QUY61327.1 ABC transport system permease protein [Gulosibacter molinativorax]